MRIVNRLTGQPKAVSIPLDGAVTLLNSVVDPGNISASDIRALVLASVVANRFESEHDRMSYGVRVCNGTEEDLRNEIRRQKSLNCDLLCTGASDYYTMGKTLAEQLSSDVTCVRDGVVNYIMYRSTPYLTLLDDDEKRAWRAMYGKTVLGYGDAVEQGFVDIPLMDGEKLYPAFAIAAMLHGHLKEGFNIVIDPYDYIFPLHQDIIALCRLFKVPEPEHWVHVKKVLGSYHGKKLSIYKNPVTRAYLLLTHYSKTIVYNKDEVEEARKMMLYMYSVLARANAEGILVMPDSGYYETAVRTCIDDNLNTPAAIYNLYEGVEHLERDMKAHGDCAKLHGDVVKAGAILGLLDEAPESYIGSRPPSLSKVSGLIHEYRRMRHIGNNTALRPIRNMIEQSGGKISYNNDAFVVA